MGLFATIGNAINDGAEALGQGFEQAGNVAQETTNAFGEAVANLGQQADNTVETVGETMEDQAETALTTVGSLLAWGSRQIDAKVEQAVENAAPWLELGADLSAAGGEFASDLANAGQRFGSQVGLEVGEFLGQIGVTNAAQHLMAVLADTTTCPPPYDPQQTLRQEAAELKHQLDNYTTQVGEAIGGVTEEVAEARREVASALGDVWRAAKAPFGP
ncbi:MAG: hypothetical protein ACFCBW_11300 [Candidatus Competibacterales bacterium]